MAVALLALFSISFYTSIQLDASRETKVKIRIIYLTDQCTYIHVI